MKDVEIEPWFEHPTQAPKMMELMSVLQASSGHVERGLLARLNKNLHKTKMCRASDAKLEDFFRSEHAARNLPRLITIYGTSPLQTDRELAGRLIRISNMHYEKRVGSRHCHLEMHIWVHSNSTLWRCTIIKLVIYHVLHC